MPANQSSKRYYMCIHSLFGSCSGSSCGCDKPKMNKNKCCSSPFTKAKRYVRVTEEGQLYQGNNKQQ